MKMQRKTRIIRTLRGRSRSLDAVDVGRLSMIVSVKGPNPAEVLARMRTMYFLFTDKLVKSIERKDV